MSCAKSVDDSLKRNKVIFEISPNSCTKKIIAPRQGQGFWYAFVETILFCIRMHTTSVARRVGLVLENFQCNYCIWVWFDSISALVGFLQVFRFPPTPRNRNSSIFIVYSFWILLVCVLSMLGSLGFNYRVHCGHHTTVPWGALQKL